jgi:2-polyprenyl-3-methyl-5-hydroxy-6-metoxy-1,4-benzoquinol methylase
MNSSTRAATVEDNRPILRTIREHEVEQILALLPPGASVLEVGGGAGWQALVLADRGYRVEAIDLARSQYREERVWPVLSYDGVHIPFPERHFDVVFSSNVLEHVESLEALMAEMRRVLKADGFGIHLLPTSSWRIWATVSHYLISMARLVSRLRARDAPQARPAPRPAADGEAANPATARARRPGQSLFPPPHGARGNFMTEIYWFSRARWRRFFRRAGWEVVRCFPNRLFYTRFLTLRPTTTIDTLRSLSRILGSACFVYVIQPKKTNTPDG